MSNSTSAKGTSGNRPDVTADDMSRVTAEDFTDLQRLARGYCRAVDSTRSRKRMNGSATVVRGGRALYGTDDASDDVTQDAVLLFAKRLRDIIASCEVSALWVETREPCAWQYVRRDGEMIVITRRTLQYWAVRDAAARNGYRMEGKPDEIGATPGAQLKWGVSHEDKLSALAVTPYLAGNGATIFRAAWGDGSAYPTLKSILRIAGQAEDLGRAGVIGKTAQLLYGGPRNSSSKVRRTRDAGVKEWRNLTAYLDEVRDELVYRSSRQGGNK